MENEFNASLKAQSDILSLVMRQVYLRMFLALLATAVTAYYVASTPAVTAFIFGNSFMFWVMIIAEFALVIGISAAINKLSTTTANLLLLLYAIVNGAVLSSIFFTFSMWSIAKTFAITAAVFLAMSIYGFTTKKDLNSFGSYCVMGLFGIIIASLVNIFLHSSTLDWIISFIGVGIFMGLTAWDTQKIKEAAVTIEPSGAGKLAVIGALSLYLDFINMFLYLLRFFGNRN